MIEGALKADGRLAAKNAVKIRAALHQVTDFKKVFNKYQETHPQPTDNVAQDRTRARSWLILNVYLNDEPLRQTVMRAWAEAYVLGQAAAGEWIAKTEAANKAADDGYIDWANWKPGDQATALLLRPTGGFTKYLNMVNADSYFRNFNKETVENLGTALSDSIAAGLDAEHAAVMIGRHVASPSRALTIAITEQNRAMSFGSIQRYKEAELEKMEWHVSDPCDKCAKNANVEVVIGQAFPSGATQPPAHPHCRCVLLPVIPGMEEEPSIEQGNITSPVVTPSGAIEQKPLTGEFGPSQQWTAVTEERWIARQEAIRLRRGLPPANERQLQIMRDQVNDAETIYERGVHVVRVGKGLKTVTNKHVEAVMKNFDQALEKLPEWRRYNPDGSERSFTLVIDNRAAKPNTMAYTYTGHDTFWVSPRDAVSSLQPAIDAGKRFMPAASKVNNNLYTIMHEMGHDVDHDGNNKLRGKVRMEVWRQKENKQFFSGYARENSDESYAEVFAQWALGEHNPLTDAYADAFGWNLTAAEYYAKFPKELQWRENRAPSGQIL